MAQLTLRKVRLKREPDTLALGNGVLPVLLQGAAHDQQGAMVQGDGDLLLRGAVAAQDKIPAHAEIGRGNDGLRAQLGLIIGMPGQVVLAVAVPVDQHAVEGFPGQLLDGLLEMEQALVPRGGLGGDAGIGVAAPRVAIPAGQAGQRGCLAEHADAVLLPHHVLETDAGQGIGIDIAPAGSAPVHGVVLLEVFQHPVADGPGEKGGYIQQFAIGNSDLPAFAAIGAGQRGCLVTRRIGQGERQQGVGVEQVHFRPPPVGPASQPRWIGHCSWQYGTRAAGCGEAARCLGAVLHR